MPKCAACLLPATCRVSYGDPVWGWNFSCNLHRVALEASDD